MNFYTIGKRFLDIVGSIIALILFSPILLAAAIHIKLVSPNGPVLADTKKRVGKDGKEFIMYKFRSMIPNAQKWLESQPELYQKYKDNSYKLDPDPRLIKWGNFLRKSSIDEMPQLFNILKGEMSLVGPRAYFAFELDEQVKKYPQTAEDIKTALTVKPGLTGVWQTSGRSEIGFVERIKMDADYASKRSLLYDLLIILPNPHFSSVER
jgi:lipopolysaccharide/colanic/teichoic acid biosynthesis glycosyltransferase